MMRNFGWHSMGGGLGPGIFGLVSTAIFWVIAAFLVILLVKMIAKSGKSDSEENSSNAINILKERYAKGEIDKKTFDEMKKNIS
jgi:putative membrane protein